jgi:hyperosmotically inducible protein
MRRVLAAGLAAACLLTASTALAKPLSDDVVTEDVRMKLAGDPVVKGGALNVDVRDGVVTLSGSVASPQARSRAQADVRRVRGVKQVINNIQVR